MVLSIVIFIRIFSPEERDKHQVIDECADKKMMRIRHFLYEGLAVSEAVSGLDASVLSSYIAVREGTLPAGVSIAGITVWTILC